MATTTTSGTGIATRARTRCRSKTSAVDIDRTTIVNRQITRDGEVEITIPRSVSHNCPLVQIKGSKRVNSVDCYRGSVDKNGLIIIGDVTVPNNYVFTDDGVDIDSSYIKFKRVLIKFAVDSVAILIHEVSGQISDVRSDGDAVVAERYLRIKRDFVLTVSEIRYRIHGNRSAGTIDDDIFRCETIAASVHRCQRLAEGNAYGFPRLWPEVDHSTWVV